MKITVPESYRDYVNDKVVSSVVDHLLEQTGKKLPSELEWPEVRAYHEACLSAQKVQADYIIFLFDLWDAIWGKALSEVGSFEFWTPDELKEGSSEWLPSSKNLWDDGLYQRMDFEKNGGQWSLLVWIAHDDSDGVYTSFIVYDEGGETVTDALDIQLSSAWEDELDADGFFCNTGEYSIVITKDSVDIDTSSLEGAVSELLSIIR
uniref:Uncharacterized protein n=1 Tax=uncultured Thiotrichaceae bacterium TaxID=298394 RepID=A0A6S6T8H2_9GAMM|nr:MAG: Unknown protein [uncultured Thiotrichaceae bacterium]